tara:strand:- start:1741 stop:1974 length:234 start_codon:yes stop_codon:yes gene_type:complete
MNNEDWKQRYDALEKDFDLIVRENEYMWGMLYKLERTATVGELMDILNRHPVGRTYSARKKIKINKPEERGYQWSQH